jgi:hypothetical protein
VLGALLSEPKLFEQKVHMFSMPHYMAGVQLRVKSSNSLELAGLNLGLRLQKGIKPDLYTFEQFYQVFRKSLELQNLNYLK